MKDKKIMKIIEIILFVGLLVIIVMVIILSISSMEDRFTKDCAKQNFKGMVKYWDLDINCSSIENIKDRVVSNNEGVKE